MIPLRYKYKDRLFIETQHKSSSYFRTEWILSFTSCTIRRPQMCHIHRRGYRYRRFPGLARAPKQVKSFDASTHTQESRRKVPMSPPQAVLSTWYMGCSSRFTRLTEHLTALRKAWCKQSFPARGKPDVCHRSVPALYIGMRGFPWQ